MEQAALLQEQTFQELLYMIQFYISFSLLTINFDESKLGPRLLPNTNPVISPICAPNVATITIKYNGIRSNPYTKTHIENKIALETITPDKINDSKNANINITTQAS